MMASVTKASYWKDGSFSYNSAVDNRRVFPPGARARTCLGPADQIPAKPTTGKAANARYTDCRSRRRAGLRCLTIETRTLEQLREDILIQFAASFPDLEVVPKKRLTVIAGTDEGHLKLPRTTGAGATIQLPRIATAGYSVRGLVWAPVLASIRHHLPLSDPFAGGGFYSYSKSPRLCPRRLTGRSASGAGADPLPFGCCAGASHAALPQAAQRLSFRTPLGLPHCMRACGFRR